MAVATGSTNLGDHGMDCQVKRIDHANVTGNMFNGMQRCRL